MNANKIRKQWEIEDHSRTIIPNTRENRKQIYGEGMKNTLLYDYQKGVLKTSKPNYMYTLDTGTGKTFIGLYHYLLWKKDDVKLFIVAPSQKVNEFGWEKSIRKLELLHNISIPYSISSYDKFKKLHPSEVKDYFIVLDECHMIKRYKSDRSKNIRNLLKHSKGYCLLSATPYSNGEQDLISYFDIFGITPDVRLFISQYGIFEETPYSKGRKLLTSFKDMSGPKAKLKNYCSPMLRLTDYIELPALTEDTVWIEPSKDVKSLKKFKKDNIHSLMPLMNGYMDLKTMDLSLLYDDVEDSSDLTKMEKLLVNAKKYHSTIKQILPNFRPEQLLTVPGLNTLERQLSNLKEKSKYVRMYREESENNIVVFYNYNIEKESIIESLKKSENFDPSRLYEISGKVNNVPFDKVETIKNSTILVQYQAGGAGIELQFANQCIFYSPTYSYQDFKQAMGRVYRNGQGQKTTFHYLITENTIEEKIYNTIVNKQDFTDNMNDLDIIRDRDFDNGFKFMSEIKSDDKTIKLNKVMEDYEDDDEESKD